MAVAAAPRSGTGQWRPGDQRVPRVAAPRRPCRTAPGSFGGAVRGLTQRDLHPAGSRSSCSRRPPMRRETATSSHRRPGHHRARTARSRGSSATSQAPGRSSGARAVGRVWSLPRHHGAQAAPRRRCATRRASSSCSTAPARILVQRSTCETLVQAVTDAATALSGAQFGAFFYNVTDDARRVVHALHAVGRAARGVRALRPAARDAAVRADVPRRGARSACDDVLAGPALRQVGAAPRHAGGAPAGAQLPRGAGRSRARAR